MADRSSVVAALAQVDLFSGLSRRALERIARDVKALDHPIGKDIATTGEDGVAFHLVRSGSAEVLVGDRPVRTLGPGDCFGELALIDGRPRSATVRTTSPTSTYTLVAWTFTPLLDEPEIAKGLLLAMCERLRAAESRAAVPAPA
jgi:CRP-like cAMP-binding protein